MDAFKNIVKSGELAELSRAFLKLLLDERPVYLPALFALSSRATGRYAAPLERVIYKKFIVIIFELILEKITFLSK